MNTENAIVHFEIPADDVERAQDFYKKTFGWNFNEFKMPANSSTGGNSYYGVQTCEMDENHMPKVPGAINGGLMKRVHPEQPFMNYVNVSSIEEALKNVKENGGEVAMPKTEIAPGMGFIGAFKDTEGNLMGLHEMSPKMKEETEKHEANG